MKRFLLIIVLSLFANQSWASIRLITYNIFWEPEPEGREHHDCNPYPINCITDLWPNRKNRLANLINAENSDFIALQEDSLQQAQFIEEKLGENYSKLIIEGNSIHSQQSIFYKKHRFKSLDSGFFNFSTRQRETTWSKFYDQTEKKVFYIFNTHLPSHSPCQERFENMRMTEHIINKIHEINIENLPVIFLGDMNLKWKRDADKTILRYITEPKGSITRFNCDAYSLNPIYPIIFSPFKTSFEFMDCKQSNTCTFNGSNHSKFDYVFLSKDISIVSSDILGRTPYTSNGYSFYISDHAMLRVDINLDVYSPDVYSPDVYPNEIPWMMLLLLE